MTDKLSGLAQIAPALGVSETTARRYIERGMIEVTWEGCYVVTVEEVARVKRETARRKVETGKIG